MNTANMSRFLVQVSEAHEQAFMVMVLDGASSHCKELKVPGNIALVFLPSYSHELNPAEQLWNTLRRDYFANMVFDSLNAATLQAESGLACLAFNRKAVKSLTNWLWVNAILNTR
jgi:transposase